MLHAAKRKYVWWSLLKGACGQVDRVLDSRSEGLVFDSQCWPCVVLSGKLRIPHCLCPPSRNRYLVHRSKVGSIVAGYIGAHLARGKVKSVKHALSWSLDSKQLLLPLKYLLLFGVQLSVNVISYYTIPTHLLFVHEMTIFNVKTI